MHRTALALAIARFFAEKFSEHSVERRPLGDAMTMAAMGAGDVVVCVQGLADTHGYGLFTNI